MRVGAVGLIGVAAATSIPAEVVQSSFDEYRTKWGKEFSDEEHVQRLSIFAENMEIAKKLQEQETGSAVYSHLSIYADQSPEEMSQRRGYRAFEGFDSLPRAPVSNITLDDSWDWIAKGATNKVKNQGSCGSCWSFSTAANIEGVGFVQTGKLVSVSEQNIMDCNSEGWNCGGGLPAGTLKWMADTGAKISSEADYPYTGMNGKSCQQHPPLVGVGSWMAVDQEEVQMMQALVKYGPLSVAVDAGKFQLYVFGIMSDKFCSKTNVNHAVNIVGYGAKGSEKYWHVRNSWGSWWGWNGYCKLVRGKCACGICTNVVTATSVSINAAEDRIVV